MSDECDAYPSDYEIAVWEQAWKRPMRKHGRQRTARDRRDARRRLIARFYRDLDRWEPPGPPRKRWPHKQARRTVAAWDEVPF